MSTLCSSPRGQSGTSMIEVLVTLIILLVGLLGLAGLQMQGLRSEMESYQRVQALILLQDMVGRINANRKVAACYAFTTNTTTGTPYLGTLPTYTPACTAGTTEQQNRAREDMAAWGLLLAGDAERSGDVGVGAMIGGRGCVEQITAIEYRVSVAWQGLGNTFANTALTCGKDLYGAGDAQRRIISLSLKIATLG